MKITTKDVLPLFDEYESLIRELEVRFNRAGIPVEFTLTVWKGNSSLIAGKAVVIYYHAHFGNSISIEGKSPIEAVTAIADAVKSGWIEILETVIPPKQIK